MINAIRRFWHRHVNTLRVSMFAVITIAIILGITVYLTVHTLFVNWISNKYNSETEKKSRYDAYLSDLQSYIDKNGVSSTDTAEITRWMNNNRNVYLFLYKDGQLFFDGSAEDVPEKPDKPQGEKPGDSIDEGKDSEEDGAGTGEGDGSENTGTGTGSGAEGGDSSGDGTDSEGDFSGSSVGDGTDGDGGADGSENESGDGTGTGEGSGAENEGGSQGSTGGSNPDDNKGTGSGTVKPIGPGGITIDYPSREEIIASAEKNGLLPVEFSDGMLFVSLVDFTDYLYLDVSNIVSLVAGFVVLAVVLMIYFHYITTKISRLAQDVSAVYEVDMSHKIRTEDGSDEFATLTKNVEQMRVSMISSLEKEKQALNANSELITSMSHDIRTPLTVLLGYIDVMKTVNADPKLSDYISASEATALRLKEISDDMFRYFLVFGGRDEAAELSSYDAKTLIDQLLAEHILLLNERGYEVNVNRGLGVKDDLMIKTDAPKLMRIIDNLFSNIYKYADKEKRITIALGIARNRLNIVIKNHVSQDSSKAESTGVGLKTCAKMCETLGIKFSTDGGKSAKVFTARLELPIVKKEAVSPDA